jgi:hypothetical protein
VRIAEEYSGELSASLHPCGVMVARCRHWGRLCGDARPMSQCLTFVDTRSSGCHDVVHTCRGRDSRHSGRRAGQRPGRAVATVIHRPTRLVADGERGPVQCRLRPDHRMHLLTPSQHHRITLGGPLCCAVQGQPQPSGDPPGPLRRGADTEAGFGECHPDLPVGGRHHSTGPELLVRHHSVPTSHCGNEVINVDSSCGLEPIT